MKHLAPLRGSAALRFAQDDTDVLLGELHIRIPIAGIAARGGDDIILDRPLNQRDFGTLIFDLGFHALPPLLL